jgi:hypothetical protein
VCVSGGQRASVAHAPPLSCPLPPCRGQGMVHFVSFDSETDFPGAPEGTVSEHGIPSGGFAPDGALVKWLAADLEAAAADRARRPWIVVGAHRWGWAPVDAAGRGGGGRQWMRLVGVGVGASGCGWSGWGWVGMVGARGEVR